MQNPYNKTSEIPGDVLALSNAAPDLPLIPLAALPKHIPSGRRGKKRHVSTIYRYVTRGVRGIRLEAWQLPDGLYSSVGAWSRFVDRLTDAKCGIAVPPRNAPARARREQGSVEAEIENVRASIGRKATKANQSAAEFASPATPRWDADRGELWLGEHLCKRLRQPAENQRLVLDAFEKQGWPSRIENPLPWNHDDDVRQRLADTVRRLNLRNPHVLFELDGLSRGVLWSPRQPHDST